MTETFLTPRLISPNSTIPLISLTTAGLAGFLASNSSATLGRPPVMSLLYAHVELVVGRLEFILPVVMTVNLWALSYVKGGESGLVSTPYLLYNCGVQLLTEIAVDGLVSRFGPPKLWKCY